MSFQHRQAAARLSPAGAALARARENSFGETRNVGRDFRVRQSNSGKMPPATPPRRWHAQARPLQNGGAAAHSGAKRPNF